MLDASSLHVQMLLQASNSLLNTEQELIFIQPS
jgi:hypothetical protein